ncbi:MAG: hypothetical protein ABJB01_08025 [Rudaea sp.]
MKRGIVFLILIAFFACPAFAADTFQAESRVLRVNDPETDLIEALGQPSRKLPLENSRGDHLGDYYFYVVRDKSVRFLIHNGRISEIYETKQ